MKFYETKFEKLGLLVTDAAETNPHGITETFLSSQ